MIYIIYDFTGLKITKKKYQQYFKTLLYTAKVCEEHSDGNKLFKIQPAVTGCDLVICPDKTAQIMSPHSIKSELTDGVNAVPDKVEFSRVLTDSGVCEKCIVCTVEDPHDLFILYDVKYDHATILFNDYAVDKVAWSYITNPVMPFESCTSQNRFLAFTPEINWALNNAFWYEFWANVFHEERKPDDKSDILAGALWHSTVGLFYDRLGNNEDAVKASSTIVQIKHYAIWPQLENDIHRHFKFIELVGVKSEEEVKEIRGHCGYLNPDWPTQFNRIKNSNNNTPHSSHELLRKCSPQKDPCVPPKWLTHLYVNSVENDGEIPDKKKLHDLLDYMVNYVASWTECDIAHSAQQMKDMLPLLVRCKIILEREKEKKE